MILQAIRGVCLILCPAAIRLSLPSANSQHQELKYVRTNNSGIDIQTAPGTDARAVFNGEVTRVFVVPGYNNSVIVRHGNYLTVYSKLEPGLCEGRR